MDSLDKETFEFDRWTSVPYCWYGFKPRKFSKVCLNVLKSGEECGKKFTATVAATKYCEKCRKTKPWYGDHIKKM